MATACMDAATAGQVEDVQLIDVREPWEEETASLPFFRLFPLSKLQVWGPSIAEQLDPSRETLVLCHHGVRSMQVATVRLRCGRHQC
eukprot:365171-Chlamydomonas_euryale.AAC.17